jgi:hypothetical protein
METDCLSLEQFTGLKLAELPSCDLLELNICAARSLPGTEKSSLEEWLAKRDEWAARVRVEIRRHLYRIDPQSNRLPTEFSYGNSLGRFFCWFMLQVLQEDCGVRYHPHRKFKPDFCKPRDVFAHGIMDDDGEGGTCSSMPVVYVSVGRAIGLPLYLVETRGHLFFRWDDPNGTTIRWEDPDLALWIPPDRFNVEGSGEGIAFYSDSHYVQWPEAWTAREIRHGQYLRSMTATESLAGLLIERGECFWDLEKRVEALKSYYFARQLTPDDERYVWVHAKRSREYQEWEEGQRELERIDHKIEQMMRDGERRRRLQGAESLRHSLSCECLQCQQGREVAERPPGMPGHPPNCHCPVCGHQHKVRHAPDVSAFAVANQLPHHTCPGHAISTFRPPLPGLPNV